MKKSQWLGTVSILSILSGPVFTETTYAQARMCPQLARMCKDGSTAAPKGDGTCALVCPEDGPVTSPPPSPRPGQHGACRAIRQVCEKAGYKAGGAFDTDGNPENGLYRDCMSDLLLGRSVSGVTLNQEQTAQLNLCKQLPHPCLEVVDACDNAKAGKGCVRDVAMGKDVPGVVKPQNSKITACAQHLLGKANSCPRIDCAAPPANCAYNMAAAPKDEHGCATSCGPLVCRKPPEPSGTGGSSGARSGSAL